MIPLASQLVLLPPHAFLLWLFWCAQPQPALRVRLMVMGAAVAAWFIAFAVALPLTDGYGLMWTLIATTVAGYLAFTAALALG